MSLIKEIIIYVPIIIIIAALASHMVAVPTGSMDPAIQEGDLILTEQTEILGVLHELNPEDVKVGDIILYKENSSNGSGLGESTDIIVHRVIGIEKSGNNTYFTLKGDNNSAPDPEKVTPDQVVGKVIVVDNYVLKIPQIGRIFTPSQ